MGNYKKTAKTVGTQTLLISIFSFLYTFPITIWLPISLNNAIYAFDDFMDKMVEGTGYRADFREICFFVSFIIFGISIFLFVIGINLLTSKKLLCPKIMKIFSIVLLIYYFLQTGFTISVLYGYNMLSFMVGIAIIILCFVMLHNYSKYKAAMQDYENAFSNEFQYIRESPTNDSQSFNYTNAKKSQDEQVFSYIKKDNSFINNKKCCVRCGTDADLNAKFCESCGYSKFITYH